MVSFLRPGLLGYLSDHARGESVTEDGSRIGLGGMESPEYLRPVYANFANVGHTPWDFRLTFALVKSPRPGQETDDVSQAGVLHPESVADIIVPVAIVQGLIAALRQSYEAYLTTYGIPGLGSNEPPSQEQA
jgi:hypothetical protein